MSSKGFILALSFLVSTFSRATYDEWSDLNFGDSSTSENSKPYADPDADGTSNLLEYAMGSNPEVSDHQTPASSIRDDRLTLSVVRPKDRSDLLYFFQFADSPAGPWAGGSAVNLLPPVDLGDNEQISGQDAASVIRNSKFARLGVVFRDHDGNGNGVFDAWEITAFGMLGIQGLGDADSDGVPDREDSDPFDPAAGRLSIMISSPEDGSENP